MKERQPKHATALQVSGKRTVTVLQGPREPRRILRLRRERELERDVRVRAMFAALSDVAALLHRLGQIEEELAGPEHTQLS